MSKRITTMLAGAIRNLVLLALLISPATQAAQRCPSLDVRAMSYNIRLDLASDGVNAWPHRRGELIGQIQVIRPDILGLQEVLSNQRRDLAAALPDYHFVGVARDDGRDAGEYSPLAVRKSLFVVVGSGTFWLSPTPDRPSLGWDASYKRIVTWARLRHRRTGTRILALNTHWDHRGLVARRESAALIGRWIERHRRPGDRLLLLGDFNAPLSEESMALLTESGQADSRGRAGSVLGGEVSFNDFKAVPPREGKAIDHILVGTGWQVRRHAIIAQHVNGRVASDHFPVMADIAAPIGQCGA